MAEQPRAVTAERLAWNWAVALGGAASPAADGAGEWEAEAAQRLRPSVDSLVGALGSEPVDSRAGHEVGRFLVAAGLIEGPGLQTSFEVLGPGLRQVAGSVPEHRVGALLGAVAAGVLEADREEATRRLYLADALFQEVFASSSVGIAVSELDGTVVEVNEAFATIVGTEPAGLVGTDLEKLFHPDDAAELRGHYRDLTEGRSVRFRRRYRLQDSTGEPIWTCIAGAPLCDDPGTPTNLVTIVEDESQLHLLEQQMLRRSREDELTGLPNRQRLVTELQDMIERAEPGTSIALCTVDLDGFSVVNEGMGRELGDRLLRSVASKICELVPEDVATVARSGPDEFAVLFKEPTDARRLGSVAVAINAELAEPVYLDARAIGVSAGIGGALLPARGLHAEELLRAADTALSRAKASGRGQWAMYDPVEDADLIARFADAAAMPLAWENGEVTLTYQPLFELATGRPMAMQALLRWERPAIIDEDDPDSGDSCNRVIDHHECLALAEQTGLVQTIGGWMLREACLQLARCHDQLGGSPPLLLVMLTRNVAQDPDLVAVVQKVLAETGASPLSLALGIPRAVLAEDRGDATDNVRILADLGVRTSILDAGDGLGYLEFLTDLPIAAIEMAPALVTRLASDDGESILGRSVVQQLPLVRGLDVHVVVQHVDSAAQARFWRDAGADYASGLHFVPPMSGADVMEWLRSHPGEA